MIEDCPLRHVNINPLPMTDRMSEIAGNQRPVLRAQLNINLSYDERRT